jgi:1,4-dihydroxy-2-naphthoyl-CoA synthase
MPVEEAYAYTSQVMVDNLMLDETREGIGAFLDKRPPGWKI